MSALAAGRGTFVAGWLEAEGFLVAHPEARVLLVTYDEPLPTEYASYSFASAVRVRRWAPASARGGATRRRAATCASRRQDDSLPLAPLFLAWMLSSDDSLHASADGQGWIWTRAAT